MHTIEAFEMWVKKRMEWIKCSYRVSNEEILIRVVENKTLLNSIQKWNGNWIDIL